MDVRRSQVAKRQDQGSILPLVLAVTVVMSLIIVALADYATAEMRFAGVAEERSDRLSAADAGMRYAIDQLKLRNAACILDTQEAVLPGVEADFNGARAGVVCHRISNGFEGIQAYAAVMTGEGVPAAQSLLSTQAGNSHAKVLGGPVYMARIDPKAFTLGPAVRIEDGPLLYFDPPGSGDPVEQPCASVKPSQVPVIANDQLQFDPELIFGPTCVRTPWTEVWKSPELPNLADTATYPLLNGSLPTSAVVAEGQPAGSYEDRGSGANACRVFRPGRYTVPPAINGVDAYFLSGDYIMDLPTTNAVFNIRQSTVVAGKINPDVPPTINELESSMNSGCKSAQNTDPSPTPGATFYLAGPSRIYVDTQGSFEIHARKQGTDPVSDYVSVQALCAPNGSWCRAGGDGGLGARAASTVTATSASPSILYTQSGNGKEFIAHAYFYAPVGQIEFGNVTNTASQKLLGGLVAARLVLQSSASAINFEIAVPTSPITARIMLTSTATKNGHTTSIQAIVAYRPYADDIDDRIRVESSRVCPGVC